MDYFIIMYIMGAFGFFFSLWIKEKKKDVNMLMAILVMSILWFVFTITFLVDKLTDDGE